METPSPEYLKGFNHGYDLQKHDPEVLEEILNIPQTDNEYFNGLKEGKAEYEKELDKSKDIENWEKDRLDSLYPDKPKNEKNIDKDNFA